MSSNLRADRTAVSTDSPTPGSQDSELCEDASTDLLEQLGDDYTRAALEAVIDRPRSGREVAEETGMSRPTAFRRLNSLVDAGFVETTRSIDVDDGHHHKQYRAVVDSFSIRLGDSGFEVAVERDGPASAGDAGSTAYPADD